MTYVTGVTGGLALFFGKTSIVLFYLKLFGSKPVFKWFTIAVITFMFCFYSVQIIMTSYFCAPRLGKPWGVGTALRCPGIGTWTSIQGPLNVFIDLYIFLLPIPVIMKLHLSMKKRLGLTGIFLTAGLYALLPQTENLLDLMQLQRYSLKHPCYCFPL